MPTKHCCFGMYNSDTRYPQDGVFFIPFVKPHIDMEKCKKWIHACRRKNFYIDNITKHTYICSKHFVGINGPTSDNPDPIPATISKIPIQRYKRQHINESTDVSRKRPKIKSPKGTQSFNKCSSSLEYNSDELVLECASTTNFEPGSESEIENITKSINADTQTCIEVESVFIKKLTKEIEEMRKNLNDVAFGLEACKKDEKQFHFYTGLTVKQFVILFDVLRPSLSSLRLWQGVKRQNYKRKSENRTLSFENQLFLTLCRLHCGLLVTDFK